MMDFDKITFGDWVKIGIFIFTVGAFWQSHEANKEKITIVETELSQYQIENNKLSIQIGIISQQLTDMNQRFARMENKLDSMK